MIAVRVGARRHIDGFVYALDNFENDKKRSASPAKPCLVGSYTGSSLISTIVSTRRETNGWRWPAFMVGYLFAASYDGASITYWLSVALGQDKFPGWNLESGVPPRRRVRTGSGRFSEGHRFPPAEPQTGQLLEAAALPRKGRRMPGPTDSASIAPKAIYFREPGSVGGVSPELAQRIADYVAADSSLSGFYAGNSNPDAAQEDAQWAPVRTAFRAVVDFPAASLADLFTKFDFVGTEEEPNGKDILAMVRADVTRLAESMGQ